MSDYNPDPDFGLNTGGTNAADRRLAMYPGDPDVQAVTNIDEDDLDQELADIASNMAYWGFMLNSEKRALRNGKKERAEVFGELAQTIRAEIRAERGDKRITDKEVQERVEQEPEYHEAQDVVAHHDQRASDIGVVCEAIKVKAEALRSLCANRRAEQEAMGSAT